MPQEGDGKTKYIILVVVCLICVLLSSRRYSHDVDRQIVEGSHTPSSTSPSNDASVAPKATSANVSPISGSVGETMEKNPVARDVSPPTVDSTPTPRRSSVADPDLPTATSSEFPASDTSASNPLLWPPLTSGDGKDEQKKELMKAQRAECDKLLRAGKISTGEFLLSANEQSSNPNLKIVGFGGATRQWNRFWVIPTIQLDTKTKDRQVQCRGGDAFEILMESDDAKVSVDRILDLGNGVHEVHVFVRRPGSYRVCVDLVQSVVGILPKKDGSGPGLATDIDLMRFPINHSSVSQPTIRQQSEMKPPVDADGNRVDLSRYCVRRGPEKQHRWQFTTDEVCEGTAQATGEFTGPPMMPPQPPIPCNSGRGKKAGSSSSLAHPHMFRSGGWVKLGAGKSCDGVLCTGDVDSFSTTNDDRWVWVSDWCTMNYYTSLPSTPSDAGRLRDVSSNSVASVVKGRWILGWGDSTLKQPMSNLVEYRLQVPIFSPRGVPVKMLDIPSAQGKVKAKHIPHFFSYRQWDVKSTPLVARFTFDWAGCPNTGGRPSDCPKQLGMRNLGVLQRHLGEYKGKTKEVDAGGVGDGPDDFPSIIVLGHFHWRYPRYDEPDFLNLINETLRGVLLPAIDDAVKTLKLPFRPLIVWNTQTHRLHNVDMRQNCVVPSEAQLQRHFNMQIVDFLSKNFAEEILIVDRFQVTSPLHIGDRYGQFGVHYGNSKGMCLTGSPKGYDPKSCDRDTVADDVVMQMWFNALAAVQTRK